MRRLIGSLESFRSNSRGDMRRFGFLAVAGCALAAFFVVLNLAGETTSNASMTLSSESNEIPSTTEDSMSATDRSMLQLTPTAQPLQANLADPRYLSDGSGRAVLGDDAALYAHPPQQQQQDYKIYLPSIASTGLLQVNSANPRYFTIGNGKATYLTGSHTWCDFQDCGNSNPPPTFDYTAFLGFLEANNHNFFRLWRAENARGGETGDNFWFNPMSYQRTGPGTALDGKPKFDLTKFNQAYFDRMRSRIMEAGDRGIYVSIMLFDGWSIESKIPNHDPWRGHPFNASNNINGINGDVNRNNQGEETHTLGNPAVTALQEAYVRKVIETVNDLDNVLYEISNESPGNSEQWQYHMISYIKNYEATQPKQHPVGMTVEWPGGDNADLFASPADWISPNGDINNPPAADGSKVILFDSDHLCGICGDRQWVWRSFTSGVNPIFMDPYDGAATGRGAPPGYDPDNANDVSIRHNMGYALTYAERMNLAAMTPRGDLCSTGYCLANPVASGAEYLVYLPSGGRATVNLSGASGQLAVEWFNPSNGTATAGGTTTGGASRSFTPPFGGDAVLYIYQ